MKCPVCWKDVALMRDGVFPRHRTKKADDTSFCPMSGQPVPTSEAEEVA